MKAMRAFGVVVLVMCGSFAARAVAAPLVTSVSPPEFDASVNQGMRVVQVKGYGIWAGSSGAEEFTKRTKAFIRREGAFQEAFIFGYGYGSGPGQQELTLNVPTNPWFSTPGTFEVMVKVDEVASNYYQVPVLSGAPNILTVNESHFTLSDAGDQEHEVRVVADNLGNPLETAVVLAGKPLESYRLGPGILIAFIPEKAFHDVGKFGLQVKSSVGTSPAYEITLTRPPVQLQPSPRPVQRLTPAVQLPASAEATAGPRVVEAETLVPGAKASAGFVSYQAMAAFGTAWSGGAQLLWTAPAQEATLSLALNVPAAGRYSVSAYFTKGPDYGTVQAALDGKPLGTPFDGYGQAVALGDRFELGAADLKAGPNALVLRVIGKHQLSQGYFVGLDRIVLTPTVAQVPAARQVAPAAGLRILR